MKTIIIKISLCILFLFSTQAKANIKSSIIAKVGKEIITEFDVENEIKINLILSKKEINQESINQIKGYAVNTIVKQLVKRNEFLKYNISEYSPNEMENYLKIYSKMVNTDKKGLKNILKINNIDYDYFVKKLEDEILWKKFIVLKYKSQIKINMVEIENELKKILNTGVQNKEYKLSEIEVFYNNKQDELNEILKKIELSIQKNGFADTAKKYSISSTAANGGSLGGWISSTSLSGLYLNELNKIQKKQTTRPIKITDSDSVIILFIDDLKINKTEIKDAVKIKEQLIKRKKDAKLNLLSRSHLSRIENQTLVRFK